MSAQPAMDPLPSDAVRFAHASRHYDITIAFYRDVVGLPVIGMFADSFGEDGTIYGLPFRGHAQVLFYRKDVFSQLGLQPPQTWDDVAADAKTIREKTQLNPIAMYYKVGAGQNLPRSGTVFISIKDKDKPLITDATRKLLELGFDVVATPGTAAYFRNLGLAVRAINKVHQGSPHIVEAMQRGEVKLVFNTVAGAKSIADSFALRRTALMGGIPYFTTVSCILAAVGASAELSKGELEVAPLQSYFLTSDQPAER